MNEQSDDEDVVDKSGNVVTTVHHHSTKRQSNDGTIDKVYDRTGEPTEAALCILAEKLGGMSHYLESGGQMDRRGALHFDVPPSVLASAMEKERLREIANAAVEAQRTADCGKCGNETAQS